jgi:hypothetical protein
MCGLPYNKVTTAIDKYKIRVQVVIQENGSTMGALFVINSVKKRGRIINKIPIFNIKNGKYFSL